MAGYIESWGRGIDIMVEGCKEYGIPEPIIEEEQGGISVTFLKDIYTEEYLRTIDINDRQVNAVLYIKEHGKINNSIYQEINNISKPTATRELKDFIEKDIISNIGTKGSSSEYVLVGS